MHAHAVLQPRMHSHAWLSTLNHVCHTECPCHSSLPCTCLYPLPCLPPPHCATQLIGILSIIAWVCGLTGILFATLKFFGKLRISEEDEHRGLDASKHGGSAYNTDGMKPVSNG